MSYSHVLFVVLWVALGHPAMAETFLEGFPDEKPRQIIHDKKDRFYVDFGTSVYRVSDKIDRIFSPCDTDENYTPVSLDHVVSSKGTLYTLIKSSYRPRKSKTTYYRLGLVTSDEAQSAYQPLTNWSYTLNAKDRTSYVQSPLVMSEKDGLFFTITYTHKTGGKKNTTIKEVWYYFNKKRISRKKYTALLNHHFPTPDGAIVFKDNNTLKVGAESATFPIEREERYTRTLMTDRQGNPHLFFHDLSERAFYHRFYSRKEQKPVEMRVDTPESGMENMAFATESDIWSVHYFFRDAFHKGLLATIQRADTGEVTKQFVIDASKTRNSGWDLVGGESSTHRILFSYLCDVYQKKRTFVLLDRIEELESLATNLSLYGDPKGAGALTGEATEAQKDLFQELATSYKKKKSNLELNVGVGVQYATWQVDIDQPDAGSGVSRPYDVNYDFSDAFTQIASMEGKYKQTHFGVELATKLIDEEVNQSGSSEAKELNRWKGTLGWEDLFFNYDVKVQMEKMTTAVFFEDVSGQLPAQNFDMDYEEVKISLLPLKRHHFGLLYQKYNFLQPVYLYKASAGSSSYAFDSQAFGEIDSTNVMAHYGYSTLDYISKYETAVSNWYVDGEIRAGISFADFKNTLQTTGRNPSLEYQPVYGGELELGQVFYRRWQALGTAGFSLKLGYRVDYLVIGSSDKPDNRDSTGSDDYVFAFERKELRHGPLLHMSLLF